MKAAILQIDFKSNFSPVIQQLSRPEWIEHPDVVRQFFLHKKSKNATIYIAPVITILQNPLWARYPELLEQLFAEVGSWDYFQDDLKELLKLPHWRDHPSFKDLNKGRGLSFARFKKYVAEKSQKCPEILRQIGSE